jgi:putative membrane protein
MQTEDSDMKIVANASIALLLLAACATGPNAKLQSAVSKTSEAEAGTGHSLTNGDVGATAHAINDGEIQLAQLAVSRASSADVRNFAQMMIDHHTMGNTQLESANYRMFRNPITDTLVADTQRTMTELQGKSGADFDAAYIGSQVRMHTMALETAKTTLMPNAQDPALRGILTTMQGQIQTHLDTARRLQTTVK